MDIDKNEVKKSKNFENNKLINPDFSEDEISDEEYNIEEPTYELNNEELEIINKVRNRNMQIDDTLIINKNNKINTKINTKVNTTKVIKPNKTLTLQEFIKTIQPENNTTNKKFSSNRVENKKKEFQTNNLTSKRHFNPRKPPYNFSRKTINNNIPEFKNIQEFPELK